MQNLTRSPRRIVTETKHRSEAAALHLLSSSNDPPFFSASLEPEYSSGASSAHDGSIERRDGSKQSALFIKKKKKKGSALVEGTGEERRREAVNPTHGMFMFNICTHQTAGINPCRYRILCHSRSRKPILKHVFKDFQLRKTVMEFHERKHRQESAPSLSCWEWVKFTTRMGMGGGGGFNLQEVDKFCTGNHQAATLQPNNVSQADGTQRPSQRSDGAGDTSVLAARHSTFVLSFPAAIRIRTMHIT